MKFDIPDKAILFPFLLIIGSWVMLYFVEGGRFVAYLILVIVVLILLIFLLVFMWVIINNSVKLLFIRIQTRHMSPRYHRIFLKAARTELYCNEQKATPDYKICAEAGEVMAMFKLVRIWRFDIKHANELIHWCEKILEQSASLSENEQREVFKMLVDYGGDHYEPDPDERWFPVTASIKAEQLLRDYAAKGNQLAQEMCKELDNDIASMLADETAKDNMHEK